MFTKGEARLEALRALHLAGGTVQKYVEVYTTQEERAEFLVLVAPMLYALARRFDEETRQPMETRT